MVYYDKLAQIRGSFTATKPLNYCIGTFLVEKTLVIVDDDNFSFAYIFFYISNADISPHSVRIQENKDQK